MLLSMTGYGKASVQYQGKKITAEIKSLNSKALDLQTRMAPLYREHEMEVRAIISNALERGKVDFSLYAECESTAQAAQINHTILANYVQQLRGVCSEMSIPEPAENWLCTLLRLPDVMSKADPVTLTDEEWAVALQAIHASIDQLIDFRRQEGEALQHKFEEKIANISDLMKQVEPYEKLRVEKIRQRIIDGLQAIPEVQYDKNRLEQEMIYYIEKLDISEEKQRLTNHLRYFTETVQTGHGQGKKLGFIAQEMSREINTTGSKSNIAEMQNLVVRMKDELEQIKEQVLNVL